MPQVGMPIFNFILFFIYKLDTILKIILFQIKLGMKFVRSSIRKKKKKSHQFMSATSCASDIKTHSLCCFYYRSCGYMSNYVGLAQKYSLTSVNKTLQHLSQSCLYMRQGTFLIKTWQQHIIEISKQKILCLLKLLTTF